jgi:hypothetical protein
VRNVKHIFSIFCSWGVASCGSILELIDYLPEPGAYRAFGESAVGSFYLGIIESYLEALNDEWLPYEILGMPLNKAQEFIIFMRHALEDDGHGAYPRIKARYQQLRGA